MSRAWLMARAFVVVMGLTAMVAQAYGTIPTEAQRRECERNGGYWSTASSMCRIGA